MIMRCLFFPFTSVTSNQLDVLMSFFPRVELLCFNSIPSAEAYRHRVTPIMPPKDELDLVEQLAAQYIEWAGIHQKNISHLGSSLNEMPFFSDEHDVTRIKSNLLNNNTEQAPESQALIQRNQLLLLKIAQIHDEQQDQIETRLKQLDQARETLLSELRGSEDLSGFDHPAKADGSEIKPDFRFLPERIHAWASYMGNRSGVDDSSEPCLWVTTSQRVFDALESFSEDVAKPLDIKQIKVHDNECKNCENWQQQFYESLSAAIRKEAFNQQDLLQLEDDCSRSGQIKLGVFSGETIDKWVKRPGSSIPLCLVRVKG